MVLVVLVTCETGKEAAKIAETLVKERLAACVNIIPKIKSVYVWKKKLVKANEVLLIAKTTEARYPELEEKVRKMHSAEVPEIIALEAGKALEEYAEWVEEID